MVRLSVFEIFNVRTDVDACDCTRGLHGHCKRICTGSWLWEKNPLPQRGLEPASVLSLTFLSDAPPTELSRPAFFCCCFSVVSWYCCSLCSQFLFFCSITGGSCHKYHICRDKHVFVATKHIFCHDKVCLPRQNYCRDKIIVATKLLS